MFDSKSASRSSAAKKTGSFRYATRLLSLDKGKRTNQGKESASLKACETLLKSDEWKGSKHAQGSKFPIKKANVNKNLAVKDVKNKTSPTNRHEKVVIVSKRSASVSVVKSSSMRRSVSVRKVSYSTSVLLSSEDSDSDEDSDDDKEEEYNGRRKTVVKQTTSKIKNYSESKSSDNGSSKKSKAIKLLREKLAPIKRKSNPPPRELRPRFPYSPTHEWPTARAHRMASLNALAKVHVLYENEGRNINESGNDGEDICVIDLLNDDSEDEKVIIKREVKSPVNVKSKNDKPKNKIISKEKNESKVASKEKNESKVTSKEKNESKVASKEKNESKVASKEKNESKVASKEKNESKVSSKEKNESKVISKEKNESKSVNKEKNESSKTAVSKPKVQRKTRKRKLADVEIIDTKHCKRMACLNAQAILAASYMQEKPKKLAPKKTEKCETLSDIDVNEVVLETKCDIKILGGEKNMHVESESSTNIRSETREEFKREKKKAEPRNFHSQKMPSVKLSQQNEDIKPASPVILLEKSQKQIGSTNFDTSSNSSSGMLTTTASKVTQYTEVTKVHINTRKKIEIKEEAKTEKQMHENDDVAITQMYHYQSKNANESYSLQMQASYKPPSKNATSHPLNASSSNQLPSNIKESIPGRPNFYNNPPPNSVLPRKPYHMNQPINRIPSVMKIDHRFSRQYGGSAFTVPHYGHPQNVPYPHNDYGYFQPAGPMIQPIHDQCPILKPVPFHPQPHLQQQPMPASAPPPPNIDPRYPHLDDNIKKINKSLPSPNHIATPQQSTQIPQSNMPVLNKRISVPRGMLSTIDCPQSPIHSGNMQKARKQPSSTELIPSYASQNNPMGDYLPQHSHPQGYPNSYEQKTYPPKQQHLDPSATNYVYHHEEKFCQNPNSQLLSQDSILDTSSPKHSSIIMHQMFASHPEAKKPLWQDTSKPEPPVSSVMFNPYVNESSNKDPLLVQVSENVTYPSRPPSVIEITEESSRDIKTYIQLEVPQSRFREKIVVVDVESDECVANDDDIQKVESIKMDNFLHSQEKVCEASELETVDAVEIDLHEQEEYFSNKSENNIKDSPDIMVIEVKKRKESAVVRRARLNGKQRTFRDCYNRPLAPLVKTKKKDGLSVDLSEDQLMQPTISLSRLVLPKLLEKSFSHGWSWEGTPFEKLIFISNDEPACIRQCYSSMRHHEGDIIKVRDCVLLRSGLRKTDLPFVAKVTALWENPDNGEMTMSLLWYYRPEHTEHGKKSNHMDDEIFASKHKDINSVACIEDKCYVLTFGEYCRYKRQFRFNEEGYRPLASVVPVPEEYPRTNCLPPTNISPDMVFFCRKVYDYRQKRLLKNPT